MTDLSFIGDSGPSGPLEGNGLVGVRKCRASGYDYVVSSLKLRWLNSNVGLAGMRECNAQTIFERLGDIIELTTVHALRCLKRKSRILEFVAASILVLAQPGYAQTASDHRERINQHVVMIEGGGWGGTYNEMVRDMSTAFNKSGELRVVPVVGEGSIQAVEDLLFLRGIDIGLMQSDVLDFYVEKKIYPNIRNRLSIVGKLYNEDLHIIAHSSVRSVFDLEGKRVNFGRNISGTYMTSDNVFSQLGIDVEVTTYDLREALRRLRNGDLEAVTRVVGVPNEFFSTLPAGDDLHLVPVSAENISGAYIESHIGADDYPNLIAPGQEVASVAVGAVMAVYNFPEDHPRRKRIENFYQKFSSGFHGLLDSDRFHPKWREFQFGDANLPGWKAFQPSKTVQISESKGS